MSHMNDLSRGAYQLELWALQVGLAHPLNAALRCGRPFPSSVYTMLEPNDQLPSQLARRCAEHTRVGMAITAWSSDQANDLDLADCVDKLAESWEEWERAEGIEPS